MDNGYPRLNARASGWLRFLHRKATTPDDWSEDGTPHEWWDRYSTEPTLNFARFDLSESSYAVALMADKTPAWREVYAEVLQGLAERHLTFWAAYDWLTQFGADPRRKDYPEMWKFMFIPEHLIGEYDTPGWVANGAEPWGLQADPIGADGNLFFKGWLNMIQSFHVYVSGKDEWGKTFEVAGVDRARFEWTQHKLAEHLRTQWQSNPMGSHCENTKVWPYCLSAAGLGFQLYDALFDKQTHDVYQVWLEHTKDKYYVFDSAGALEQTTFYYDPLIEHFQRAGANFGLALSFYTMPQEPMFGEFLYHAAVKAMSWDDPSQPIMALPDPRFIALGLAVSKEFGDYATYAKLRTFAENNFEPKFFGDDGGEFGFYFGFGENYPRGQLSALAICAEIGDEGAWRKLFREPNMAKFSEPTVAGIDYPALGVAQAHNDKASGVLHLDIFAGSQARLGQETNFRITTLPDSKQVKVLCDGKEYDSWKVLDDNSVEIKTTINSHVFQIYTAYKSKEKARGFITELSSTSARGQMAASPQKTLAGTHSRPPKNIIMPPPLSVSACPCC